MELHGVSRGAAASVQPDIPFGRGEISRADQGAEYGVPAPPNIPALPPRASGASRSATLMPVRKTSRL